MLYLQYTYKWHKKTSETWKQKKKFWLLNVKRQPIDSITADKCSHFYESFFLQKTQPGKFYFSISFSLSPFVVQPWRRGRTSKRGPTLFFCRLIWVTPPFQYIKPIFKKNVLVFLWAKCLAFFNNIYFNLFFTFKTARLLPSLE